jgi:regulator of sigma E protease
MALLSSSIDILLLIIGFGTLIFVHEAGHFLAAKWAGIRTEAFAVGMGPVLISWRRGVGVRWGSSRGVIKERTGRFPEQLDDVDLREWGYGETEYSLRWLPLGGFVKMLGQDDMNPTSVSEDARSFNTTPIARRMVVVSAGVIANILLAGALFVYAFSVGVAFEAPIIGAILPDAPAYRAVATAAEELGISTPGLLPGDRVVSIDGEETPTFPDLMIAAAMGRPDTPLTLVVRREGIDTPLTFSITPEHNETTGLQGIGVLPASSTTLRNDRTRDQIVRFLHLTDLDDLGVMPGMRMVSANGVAFSTWEGFREQLDQTSSPQIVTMWETLPIEGGAAGEVAEVVLPILPVYEILAYPESADDGFQNYEQGLLGLVPLVEVGSISPTSPNQSILEEGDVVLRLGSSHAPRMRTFYEAVSTHGGGTVPIQVLRDGQTLDLDAVIEPPGVLGPRPMMGVTPRYAWSLPVIATPMLSRRAGFVESHEDPSLPTAVAGHELLGGSVVLTVAGRQVANWREIHDALQEATASAAANGQGAPIELVLTSPTPGQEHVVTILDLTPAQVTDVAALGQRTDLTAALFDPVYAVRSSGGNPFKAVSMGVDETAKLVMMTYLTIDRLVRGTVGVDQLRGPVGIVHIGTQITDRGLTYVIFFLAMISVNLAVINFLPLPIVDGGLFLFLIYEKLKGRPPSIGFQNAATLLGLLLIGTLFVVTFYNDVARLVQ